MLGTDSDRELTAGVDGVADQTAADQEFADTEFADLLDRRAVDVVFLPILDLHSGQVVGLEALARGPVGTQFASPQALFDAGRRTGRVAELDWVCRTAAFGAVLDAGVPPAMSLFVNVEAQAVGSPCPPDLAHLATRAESMLRVFVEVNDRTVAADPAGVLSAVDRAREMGWGVAIDDVGASRAPLTLLPIIQADVVKLDLRRLAGASPADSTAVVSSLLRYVERSGAALIVEGIESEADATWARALGASYGQGFHLGAPGPLKMHYAAPLTPVGLITITPLDLEIASPFELMSDRPHETMRAELLDRLALLLAYGAHSTGAWPIFLIGMGREGALPVQLSQSGIPAETLLFVAFGTGLEADAVPNVRSVRLGGRDPLADEKFVVVLGDRAPLGIFARATTDGRFDVAVTQDRELVYSAAHHLIARVPPPGASNRALGVLLATGPADDARAEDRSTAGVPTAVVSAAKRGWRARLGGQ
ncbi:sensor domain-containing phosphodiesterase [Pengzhenrongella sicca]|uniref:EAL domain-containing protein n=1 Tax=Pengzhenrongella sicca TaxID=2819238 RepID=A0A8A4ZA54_9MICO|nr:EAL domain-containing protein [Pengzhenrongella sicca]QTE27909.1 EAL domain-containing protein [Pengzhenrongella sicca]